jgi:hypothetical protein
MDPDHEYEIGSTYHYYGKKDYYVKNPRATWLGVKIPDRLNPDQNNDEALKQEALRDVFWTILLDGIGDLFEGANATKILSKTATVMTEAEKLAALDDKALMALTRSYYKEMNLFFNTNGGMVPAKNALLAYRENILRYLGGALKSEITGSVKAVNETAKLVQAQRLDLINEALNLYYK